jgi:spermidine synthase
MNPLHFEALSKLPTWETAVNNEDNGKRQRRLTEASTQRYEEMLIYPALLAHPNPQVIVVVGATSVDLARRQMTERWPTSTTTVLTFLGDTVKASEPYHDEIALQRLNALRTEENRTVDVVILDVKNQFLDNRCHHDNEEGLEEAGEGYCNP